MSYFEIAYVKEMSVVQDGDELALKFTSDNHEVVVCLSLEQLSALQGITLNYCPGMPGAIKFHENRLKS